MYNTILFDLDGTLLDTTSGVISAVKKTIKQYGFEMPSESILKTFVGPPMQKSMAEKFNLNPQEALKVANDFRANYKKYSLYDAQLYPGIISMLDDLKCNGFKIAIATNKSHDNAESIIKYFQIDKYCDYYLGSDLGGKLTKADIILKCLDILCADSSKTVLIGDSEFDLVGANQVGIDFIGVTYGFGFKPGVDKSKNMYFDNVPELNEFLNKQKEIIGLC